MQSSRKLIDNILRGKFFDRVGLNDYPWDDTIQKWVAHGYPTEKRENKDGIEEELPVDAVDYFPFDMFGVGGWFDTCPLQGVSELIEENDEWEVKRDGAGAVLKYWKNKSGTPEHIDFSMTSREIWEADYRSHLLKPDRERLSIDEQAKELAKRKQQGLWTYYEHFFIWEQMRRSLGDLCMYENLLLDKAWIHDFNRVYTDFFKAHYKILFEEVGIPDGIRMCEDLGYKNGLFCSPEILKELIFPYFKEMVDFFHSYDLPVILHSCGGIEAALPLIVEAGFDALNPMERKAGCDPVRFAEKYSDKLAFIGGLDTRIYESGDSGLIRREVTKLINDMKCVGARFVFGSDHSISTNVKLVDFEYAIRVFQEHMVY